MKKKHSLMEHWNDVSMWWYETRWQTWDKNQQVIFFLAYERWSNDKELLTVEDGYEFEGDYFPDPVLDHPGIVSQVA